VTTSASDVVVVDPHADLIVDEHRIERDPNPDSRLVPAIIRTGKNECIVSKFILRGGVEEYYSAFRPPDMISRPGTPSAEQES